MEMKSQERIDFTIVSKPDYISLECPFCHDDIKIDWNDVDVPEDWQGDWGYVECPTCEKLISLGDWDYD